MIELIDALIEAPPSPLGPKDKENLMVLRNRLKPVSVPVMDAVIDTTDHSGSSMSGPTVMMSYAWETNKPLVEQLTKILKQNGIDVWRDEEGSSKIGKMTGDIWRRWQR